MTAPPVAKNTKQQFDEYDRFVSDILGLCAGSTKAQADLRSGLGRPLEQCDYMHRYLVPRVGGSQQPGFHTDRQRAYYMVAALIAGRPRVARDADRDAQEDGASTKAEADSTSDEDDAPTPARSGESVVEWWKRPNFGAALGEAVNQHVLKADTAEADLHLMVRQGREALQRRLPALTRQLLNAGIRIDWSVLLHDLARWNHDRDRIATRWLEAYFQIRDRDDRDTPSDNTTR